MNEQERNLCALCGGPLQASHLWCPGPHSKEDLEPAPKHDGKLDERGDYTVELWVQHGKATVDIDENISSWVCDNPRNVELTPKQALSLLAWLKQEEQELQRLAKEQGH